jgi:hypothetical protein
MQRLKLILFIVSIFTASCTDTNSNTNNNINQPIDDLGMNSAEDRSPTTMNDQDLAIITSMMNDAYAQDFTIKDQDITDLSVTDLDISDQTLDSYIPTIDMHMTDMQIVDMLIDMQILDMLTPDAMQEIDATVTPDPPRDCFPAAMNDNRVATSFFLGPHTNDTDLCNETNASDLDQQGAELGYSGGDSIFIGQQEVSGCLVADFGDQCILDEHVGIGVSMRAVAEACDAPNMNSNVGQCDVQDFCGTRPGASALLFVASNLEDPRFVSRIGSCGEGYFFSTLTPINSFTEVNSLETARYFILCRPKQNCEADQADLSIDAMYLTWRQ